MFRILNTLLYVGALLVLVHHFYKQWIKERNTRRQVFYVRVRSDKQFFSYAGYVPKIQYATLYTEVKTAAIGNREDAIIPVTITYTI